MSRSRRTLAERRTLLGSESSARTVSARLASFGLDATDFFDLLEGRGYALIYVSLEAPGLDGLITMREGTVLAPRPGDDAFLERFPDGEKRRRARAELEEMRLLDAISYSPRMRSLFLRFFGERAGSSSAIAKITRALSVRAHALDRLSLLGNWLSEPAAVGDLIRAAVRSRTLELSLIIDGQTSVGDHLADERAVGQVLEGLLPEGPPPNTDLGEDRGRHGRAFEDPRLKVLYVDYVYDPVTVFAKALGRVLANEWVRVTHLATEPYFDENDDAPPPPRVVGLSVVPSFAGNRWLRTLSLGVTADDVREGSLRAFLVAFESNRVLEDLTLDMRIAAGLDEATTAALTTMLAANRSLTRLSIEGDDGTKNWFRRGVDPRTRYDLFLALGEQPTLRRLHLARHWFTASDGQAFLAGRVEASMRNQKPVLEECLLATFALEDDSAIEALLAPSPDTGILRLQIQLSEHAILPFLWPSLGRPGCPLMHLYIDQLMDDEDVERLTEMLRVNSKLTFVGAPNFSHSRETEASGELILNRTLAGD